jgi:hypothetical protein
MTSLLGGGGGAPKINFTPGGFNAGGINASFSGGGYNISEGPGLAGNLASLQQTYGNEAAAFGKLAGTVQPGFSQFRRAGLSDLATQQKRNLSNLSTNLSQRRILGSSFANSQVSQANADYEKNRADFIAQSYLQELQASTTLTQQQFEASSKQFMVAINQSNLEAGLAAQLTGSANAALSSVAKAQAELDAQAAAGSGKLLGTILSMAGTVGGAIVGGPIGASIGGAIGGAVGGGISGKSGQEG